ncbi:hypothetical protein CHR53_14210 [Neobacillus mesonae]|uniref:Uncharacterized protein n=1 Tax=Neobacillus mesonae TaxID=1193713 RepID=A0A3T0I6L5_9BACI|nr:hypothetical protein CHR53_14210 [Neobacillus mesonae]
MAREAKSEFKKGTPLEDIRKMIDEKYKGTGTPSTPTPMPKA